MSELRLTYNPDDEDNRLGTLVVHARWDGFVAHAESYVGLEPLIRFADALATYPIAPDPGVSYFTGSIEDEATISVVPLTSRGHLSVVVTLSHRGWWEEHQRYQKAKLQMITDYAALDTFRRQLSKLSPGGQLEAILSGVA